MWLWGGYIDQMLQMITHQSDLVAQDDVQLGLTKNLFAIN